MQGLHPSGDGANIDALGRLATQAGAVGLAAEAKALADRVRDGLLYVTCVGQFKRGKSSLINALLGATVLPVGVAPVTALVTIVRQGPRSLARIRRHSGQTEDIALSDLVRFVSEEQNPQNVKGIAAVEVFLPSDLLSHGLCLVDTPGVGSVFANNTEATRAFVPHVDAALVVLGADPPISAGELTLVEEIAGHCDTLIFVMNKADRMNAAERAEAVAFTRRVLAQRVGITDIPLLQVSAAEQLAGHGPNRDWSALTQALTRLSTHSRADLVLAAEARGLALLAARLRHRLEARRRAL
ncbi:MAG: hypothetical protein GXP62_12070, partial [Oligoflexia bacterium]|nr:hypothetical protein [Oligoflexia bacterium]